MKSKRIISSAYLSNTFEFFDYTLFGAMAFKIEQTFFKNVSWIDTHTLAIFAFCLSLLVRPIGSIIFGYIGDKISRLLSLRLSIACMTISSFTMALIPSSDYIGQIAVWIVFLTRILQGISAGGEYNGAAIFAIEHYQEKPWIISGLLTSSAIMGLVLASTIAFFLNHSSAPDYLWRFGFGFGGCIGISSFLLRQVKDSNPQLLSAAPPQVYKNIIHIFGFIFFVGGQTSALSYFIFVNLKQKLAETQKFSHFSWITTSVLLLAAIFSIIYGKLAQNYGGVKLMRYALIGMIIGTPAAFFAIANVSIALNLLGLLILGLVLGSHGATQHASFQKLVPSAYRQRLISIAFSLGTGILSSITIWAAKFFNLLEPSYFYFWFSSFSLIALYFFNKLEKPNAISF